MLKIHSVVVLLFLFGTILSQLVVPNIEGTYVQCDHDSHDKTVIVISPADEGNLARFPAKMQYISGGCGGNQINYELNVDLAITFEDNSYVVEGAYEITETYNLATAVPRTAQAQAAFENSCPTLVFQVDTETDVVDCLFCPGPQYDIFGLSVDGGFFLGDTVTCDLVARPTSFNPYEFTPVNPAYYGGKSTIDYYSSIQEFYFPTVTYPTVSNNYTFTKAQNNIHTSEYDTLDVTLVRYSYNSYVPYETVSSSSGLVPSLVLITLAFVFGLIF